MNTAPTVRSTETTVRVEGLAKSFGDLRAVDGLSFEIRAGEVFGLLGPNGAGKSTTIHMLVGALAPDAGRIEIAGRTDPTDPATRRALGIAPQDLALYEDLTGRENLAFFGRLQGLRGRRLADRVGASLELAGLTDRAGDLVSAYSGGMQRRLNLACALVHEPCVLFLDEPTVGVDPQSRGHLFEAVERLRGEGISILYTTHYMEEAERLCDRVGILDEGRILALDTVDRLIEAHGGLSRITAEVDRVPSGVRLPDSPDPERLVTETDRPLELVARLSRDGVEFGALRVDRPNLESVFLALTGRRLRDGGPGA